MYDRNQWIEQLKSRELLIFGAGNIAEEVAYCLQRKPYELKIHGFMVSKKEGNRKEIFGRPVIDIAEGRQNSQRH